MNASHNETEAFRLVRTKLYQPRISGDLVPRPRLLERLEARRDRPLTLVSAPAGYGKTTLISSWRDAMLMHTSSEHASWYIVDANIKRHARLNIISHLPSQIPYEDLTAEPLELPPRQDAGDYEHPDFSKSNPTLIPAVYP